eukprot:GFUD01139252.1.p1 GENE.GFUD01139252.1~~GFUD01139252.1.p1  ORF type:complete len:372 (+),score=70.15 GFUD01139252.1:131-1246(+)
MFGLRSNRPAKIFILFGSLTITSEACLKYVPYERPCACKRSDEGRGRGSIWNELYNDQQGLAEEPSPRFWFQVGPIITTATPCCETPTAAPAPTPTQPPVTRLQNATGCGVKGSNRIVGGTDAAENEFPWMCGVLNSDNSFWGCGATLISCNPTIIISAAHCFQGYDGQPNGKKISCGAHRMRFSSASPLDSNEERLTITEIINHPDYNPNVDESNDIAVIKVDGSFNCATGKIFPACLPDKSRLTYEGWVKTTVTGWGRLQQGATTPEILQTVRVTPVSDATCKEAYATIGGVINGDVMLCAGFKAGGKDSCQGDNGGPLVTRDDRPGFSLIGVVSWGAGCALPDYYGVYTEVSYFLDWIAQQYGLDPVL